MNKPMSKPVKIAVGIYLAIVLLMCSSYLALILVGSLQGNDMSNSVLDSDHRHINSVTKDSTENISNTELNKASAATSEVAKDETTTKTDYKTLKSNGNTKGANSSNEGR
ncbi:hypothetical protein BUY43_00075 [Staphylococcus devriesei]|uniref:Uncharacterized protein n=1 Tax=Staphylococcus devriesei TaxID=586733 RepID=A0A2K4DQV5_9STAP|nr:hypothetical protein [Staphylococcus devriesei]PNZ89205.1 hypothetical protein CD147_03540 [Staphylococcus devriesei]PTE73525.1 hypothetical protein BUY44_05475 [Staphylococcus devriesei]PTF04852.1 hypothetical protein BUY45_02420 [Staphylococcus devriesei]PTF14952.1 hypothetical protein BUY47_02830 [Staphylococcus devriesei]PTF16794.1 hypothetical protein BUY48_00685 [Staphylococcus devriesei]